MGYRVVLLTDDDGSQSGGLAPRDQALCDALAHGGHQVATAQLGEGLVPCLAGDRPDAVMSALTGSAGHDGSIPALLDVLQVPFVGSPASVCRSAWDRSTLEYVVDAVNRSGQAEPACPNGLCLPAAAFASWGAATVLGQVVDRLPGGYPVSVRPACSPTPLDRRRADDAAQLAGALTAVSAAGGEVLVEDWIGGVELAVPVLGTGERAYALPPVEVRSAAGDGEAALPVAGRVGRAPVPAELLSPHADEAEAIRSEIERAAVSLHCAYGCQGLSCVHLVWDGARPVVLAVDAAPALSPEAFVPQAAQVAGISLPALLTALLEAAVEGD